jgi:hypothetical protein
MLFMLSKLRLRFLAPDQQNIYGPREIIRVVSCRFVDRAFYLDN